MSIKNKIVAAVATGTLLAVGVFAQGPIRNRIAARHHRGEFLATFLDLTDAQKTQAKAIFEDAKTTAKPVVTQLMAGHEQMRELVKSNAPDAQIDALAAQQGALVGKLSADYAKAFEKVYAILTPDQKAKAEKLHDQIRNRIEERMNQESGF